MLERPLRCLTVVYAPNKPDMPSRLDTLRGWIAMMGWQADFINARGMNEPLNPHSDLIVVLGGDGTFLAAARLASHCLRSIPLLGVDMGRLGFLSEVAFGDLPEAFARIATGDFSMEPRNRMRIRAHRGSELLGDTTALNDGVLSKGAFARLVELATYVNEHYVTTYDADGLIIATPTGSTAYALSAGGPLLTPDLPVSIIAPICPHTLAARPIVVDHNAEIVVDVKGPADHDLLLAADGQIDFHVRKGDRLQFTRADNVTYMVKLSGIDFFTRLHTKLNWGQVRRPGDTEQETV
jgi:NAD+ kinase